MRKLVYIFVTVLTCYMAGVFRSVPLMALGGMEAVLFAAAFLQARYLKRHVSAEVLRHWEMIEKSAWLACRIKLENTGKLPVSRFQIKIRYGYCREAGHAGRQKSDGKHTASAEAARLEKGARASAEAVRSEKGARASAEAGRPEKSASVSAEAGRLEKGAGVSAEAAYPENDAGAAEAEIWRSDSHTNINEERFSVQKKANIQTKYIDGSCGQGESTVQMEVTGRYCGIMTLHMVRLRVYDYLSLFSCARKMDGTVEVAVYPQEKALQLELSSLGEGEEGLLQERISNLGGEIGGEVRQLREYQSGDSSRYIHWNQTARTGQLWVKEYEREADSCIRLFLDMEGMEEADEAEADAFYELVSALVLGLLKQTASVLVGWHDGAGRMADMEVGNGEQRRELLLCLYRRWLPGLGDTAQTVWGPEKAWEPENGSSGGILKLDMRLRLYRNDTLLYTFSADNLEEQITGGKYVLDGACCGL